MRPWSRKALRPGLKATALVMALAVLAGCSGPAGDDDPTTTVSTSAVAIAIEAPLTTTVTTGDTAATTTASPPTTEAKASKDLVIPVSGVSSKATFYEAVVDGTTLEVLAVKAPDGTIRTAFNTCQVCYDSGRGFYKQEGDTLVCQNCGNRFTMDKVEVSSGGCNPVPIFDANKKVDGDAITISYAYLKEAAGIFANWKTAY